MDILSNGILNLSNWGLLVVTLLLTHITIAGVTIYLHRHQSHNALTLHPVISHFFRFWLWLTTGMVTQEWVAIHRKHHAKCELDDDPHSPQRKGIMKILLEGSELYRQEAKNQQTLNKYGHGTPNDWLENNLYSRYPFLGIILMLLVNIVLFGAIGISIFAVQMLWIPVWAAGVINGIGHFWGYRNFETVDASRNISPWGILIGGEELHNNHHAHSQSARLSNKAWEFDIGWFYIRSMEFIGLAEVRKVAPKVVSISDKDIVDMVTVRAVIRNRAHILKQYGRNVIRPVIRQERQYSGAQSRRMYRKVRKLMTREDIKPDVSGIEILNTAIQQSKALETVYNFKQQLKELWEHSASNNTRRVEKLQLWCKEAEKSGIEALQNFAEDLQKYTLQTT